MNNNFRNSRFALEDDLLIFDFQSDFIYIFNNNSQVKNYLGVPMVKSSLGCLSELSIILTLISFSKSFMIQTNKGYNKCFFTDVSHEKVQIIIR